jgi:ATP-dependent Clp protease ATP-binding subunit ClpB
VDFRNTVIILTSNIGSAWILEHAADEWGTVETKVREALHQAFRPEFLNRIDEIIVFRPLSREDLEKVVGLQLERLAGFLRERDVTLEVTPGARRAIAEEGYDPAFGARPMKRAIQHMVSDPLAMAFLDGRFTEGDTVRVDLGEDGALAFERRGA